MKMSSYALCIFETIRLNLERIPSCFRNQLVEGKIKLIQDMPFDELKHRLVKHAQLCSAFRHFSLLRLEPFEEKVQPKLEEIPFLMSKKCMMDRYFKGKLLINCKVVY